MGAPVLSTGDLADAAQIRESFGTSTPLWFYILREAELTQDGLQLGAVGGRIVGEVFIGLLPILSPSSPQSRTSSPRCRPKRVKPRTSVWSTSSPSQGWIRPAVVSSNEKRTIVT